MTLLRRRGLSVLVAAVALAVLLALRPLGTSRALAIWVVLVAALALAAFVRRAREEGRPRRRPRFDAELRRRPAAPATPVELLRMERELELGVASAAHARRRLLPLLRAAAAARVGSRHGIDLERNPARAAELLGEDVWEVLRPDRPQTDDRHGPGVPRERVAAVIERLESL